MGRGRAPCCDKVGLNKGAWTAAEDLRLISHIQKHGHTNWRALPKQAGLLRCGKSCRLRWINYLRPDIKRGNFTGEEEETIIRLHGLLGNKWSKIASYLPGRTDNEIKNVWNTHIKKRLMPKEPKPLAKESSEQASSPSPISSGSSGDQQERNDDGKHTKPLVGNNTSRMESNQDSLDRSIENPLTLNSETKEDIAMLDLQSGPCQVSEGTHPASSSLSFSSTESYVGSSDIDERNQVSFIETTDILIEPEFWCLIDDDSWLFTSAADSSVEDGGHKNPANSQEDSTAEVEDKTWVAYLEKELDLCRPIDGSQQSPLDATDEQLHWCGDKIDPASGHFQNRPFTQSMEIQVSQYKCHEWWVPCVENGC